MKRDPNNKKPTKLLTAVTALLLAVGIVADVAMFGVFPSSLDKAFPGQNGDPELQKTSYANGLSVAQKIEEEGAVLLKNDGALPLAGTNRKINLLGYASANPVYGGTGSGGSSYTANRTDFVKAFTDAGFEVNQNLVNLYSPKNNEGGNTFSVDFSIPELPATEELAKDMGVEYQYTGDCSFEAMKDFSDTAVVVFSRKGGEGNDLPTSMAENTSYAPDQSKHYLELNSAEQSLLEQAEATFDNVIVLINSGNAMELGFLNDEGVDAALWIGDPGDVGTIGIVNILTGAVNPSGRLPDIYPYAVETTPSYYNFDTFEYTNSNDCFKNFESHPAYLVEYQEGISVGYRYYETRESYDYTTREGENLTGLSYNDVVQFPFGYGLSYTSFDWELENTIPTTVTAQDTLEWNVKVTNTGNVAGKDVVELYYSAPYYSAAEGGSGLQKAGEVLGGFAKTKELQPGETETVTISMPVEQMASYDAQKYYTSTGSYVLEAGEYQISLRTDSHTVKDNLTMTCKVAENEVFQDSAFGSGVENCKYVGKRSSDEVVATNQFDDAAGDVAYLSRDTWQIVPGTSKEATAEQLEAFNNALVVDDSYVNADDTAPTFGAKNGLTLKDMEGLAYDDAQWDKLLDQLTLDDMYKLLGADGWGSAAVDNIGKGQTYEMDGPAALSYVFDAFMGTCTYKTVTYPAEVLLAATWNVDLASEFGDAISQEGKAWNISGWYAPGANTHRNAFAGRNFEYYSEDGFLSGSMSAATVGAAEKNGMYCYIKHFALNERETWRHYGLCTWADEQAMREIYFVPFEKAVKEGGSTAVMSSYNNIGTTWAGASTALLTNVLRNEWGFIGTVITDNNEEHGFMDIEKAVLAGGTNLLFGWGTKTFDNLSQTATGQLKMREAAHQYLYTLANSYGVDVDAPVPMWRTPALVGSVIVYVLVLAGVVVILRRRKYNKTLANTNAGADVSKA